MILIGQYDSPFVRRIAVALNLYALPYAHWPWSTFGDGDRLAAYNPLRRVPTLVLADGEVLIEGSAILDHLDTLARPDDRLIPAAGPERRALLKTCALATGLCDKMVSLVYERILHDAVSDVWASRCEGQIVATLDLLEADKAATASSFWSGDRPGHADIMVACALRFLGDAHPTIAARASWPHLTALADRCEAMPAFASVVQTFVPPR